MIDTSQMPQYLCHKKVHALRIKVVSVDYANLLDPKSIVGGVLEFEENHPPIEVDADYLMAKKPQVGGYYVVYEDGYPSYSPAKAMQDGYTLIEKKPPDTTEMNPPAAVLQEPQLDYNRH